MGQKGRTSNATPGMNMMTARPWKYFLRAFNPSVGTRLSAASKRSLATFETLEPFGRLGIVMLLKVFPMAAVVGGDIGYGLFEAELSEAEPTEEGTYAGTDIDGS